MKIDEMIREERMRQKMSQKQLAEAVGVTTRAIMYWENGQRQISLENADKVCRALKVKVTIGE